MLARETSEESGSKEITMSLKNKVAIVTGGNSGIGQAIVLELARQGASIVIDYVVHPDATETLEQQIAKLGYQSIGVEADVSKLADLQKLADTAVSRFGHVDIAQPGLSSQFSPAATA